MEVMGLMLGEFVDEYTGDFFYLDGFHTRPNTTCSARQQIKCVFPFSVRVIDVFAMPQSGTGVSVEAVDPVFQVLSIHSILSFLSLTFCVESIHNGSLQAKMLDMLKQTGRPEMVVGW